jgi:hypothetical protein
MKNRLHFFMIGILLVISQITHSQTYTAGSTYFGQKQYIEYLAGNTPIIISAPHGGYLTPSEIPNRNCNGATTIEDAYTEELTREIAQEIFRQTGKYPHMIINRLDRVKLDANREVNEATCGNSISRTAWNEYHQFITNAKSQINNAFTKGIYVDVHGHSHRKELIELGYMLYDDELRLSDATLNTTTYLNYSSVKNLAISNPNTLTHAQVLRGNMSLGTLLEGQGYPSVPSTTNPAPKKGDAYFSGGYNVDTHGSRKGGSIDGVQMECNKTGIRDNVTNRQKFAKKFATVLLNYIEYHYKITLRTTTSKKYIESIDLEEFIEESFKLYPNPAQQDVSIQLAHFHGKAKVVIFNSLGQKVLEKDLLENNTTLSLDGFVAGIYLVQVNDGDDVSTKRLLVK